MKSPSIFEYPFFPPFLFPCFLFPCFLPHPLLPILPFPNLSCPSFLSPSFFPHPFFSHPSHLHYSPFPSPVNFSHWSRFVVPPFLSPFLLLSSSSIVVNFRDSTQEFPFRTFFISVVVPLPLPDAPWGDRAASPKKRKNNSFLFNLIERHLCAFHGTRFFFSFSYCCPKDLPRALINCFVSVFHGLQFCFCPKITQFNPQLNELLIM